MNKVFACIVVPIASVAYILGMVAMGVFVILPMLILDAFGWRKIKVA